MGSCWSGNRRRRVAAGLGVVVAVLVAASPGTGGRQVERGALGFGSDGTVVTDTRPGAGASAVAIDANGRIVVAGGSGGQFVLARYRPDGKLDTAFAHAGLARLDFGQSDGAAALAFQRGKILVGGATCTRYKGVATADSSGPCAFALARYKPDGTLDRQFGRSGKTITPLGATQFAIATLVVLPDGSILAGGGGAGTAAVIENHSIVHRVSPFSGALVRYTAAGRLDARFGTNGVVFTTAAVLAHGIGVEHDGRIAVAGFSAGTDPTKRLSIVSLARITADGRPDRTWGHGGVVEAPFPDRGLGAVAAALQRDGRVIVFGDSGTGFLLARYTKDGRPDTTFGRNGSVTTTLGGIADAGAVALTPGGQIVAVGTVDWRFAIVRYRHDGTPDPGFGRRGSAFATFGGADVEARDVAIQPDRKLVTAGALLGNNRSSLALARFTGDGALDAQRTP